MKYQQYELCFYVVLVLALVTLIAIFLFQNARRRHICGCEICKMLDNEEIIPVEIIRGQYQVIGSICENTLTIIRFENGRQFGKVLTVAVPRRMSGRVKEGHVYYFHFDYKNHEIHFDADKLYAEPSDYPVEDIFQNQFPLKAKVLAEINR